MNDSDPDSEPDDVPRDAPIDVPIDAPLDAPLDDGLHVIASPIGNLGDFSPRAQAACRGASLILCEDTRVTGILRKRFNFNTPLQSYRDANAERIRPQILERLKRGEAIALLSDAGTPTISDPGYRLVREASEIGIPIRAVPGPCAAVAALSVAGIPTDRFLFVGFITPKTVARRKRLNELLNVDASIVIYETARRLTDLLQDLVEILDSRKETRDVAVARELTKRFEETRRDSPDALLRHYLAHPPKGEATLLIAPPTKKNAKRIRDRE